MAKVKKPSAQLPKGQAERLQFPKLIAKNPNYFGNFPGTKLPPVFPLSNDIAFEELTCVGYNPDRGVLEAVVQLKTGPGYLRGQGLPGYFEDIPFLFGSGTGFFDARLHA